VPDGSPVDKPGWADLGLLAQCGARILRSKSPRAVKISGIIYEEGQLDSVILRLLDDQFEAAGQGRPNGTDSLRLN